MKTSCRAANLRPLLNERHIGAAFEDFMAVFNRNTGEEERGMRLDAILRNRASGESLRRVGGKGQEFRMDDSTYAALRALLPCDESPVLRRPALRYPKVFISGIFYHTAQSSRRDSNILFTSSPGTPTVMDSAALSSLTNVGSIQNIFVHKRTLSNGEEVSETFLAVARYTELQASDIVHDRFRQFPIAGGRLVYDRIEETRIIRASQVICHVAKTKLVMPELDENCAHVLPLDRVRFRCLYNPIICANV